jgi:hypothetical protein
MNGSQATGKSIHDNSLDKDIYEVNKNIYDAEAGEIAKILRTNRKTSRAMMERKLICIRNSRPIHCRMKT